MKKLNYTVRTYFLVLAKNLHVSHQRLINALAAICKSIIRRLSKLFKVIKFVAIAFIKVYKLGMYYILYRYTSYI